MAFSLSKWLFGLAALPMLALAPSSGASTDKRGYDWHFVVPELAPQMGVLSFGLYKKDRNAIVLTCHLDRGNFNGAIYDVPQNLAETVLKSGDQRYAISGPVNYLEHFQYYVMGLDGLDVHNSVFDALARTGELRYEASGRDIVLKGGALAPQAVGEFLRFCRSNSR